MTDSDQKITRKRRTWRARILGFLIWCTVMGLLCAALLTVGSYFLFRNRTAVVNRLLEEIPGTSVVQVGAIGFPEAGRVLIEDVRFRLNERGNSMAEVPVLEVGYSWTENRRPRIESIVIGGPAIRLGDNFLEFLAALRGGKQEKGGGAGLPVFDLQEIRIDGGRVVTDFTDLPRAEFDFDAASRDFKARGTGEMSSEPMLFALKNFRFGSEDAAPGFELAALELVVRPRDRFRAGTVAPFELENLALDVTPELLAGVRDFAAAFKDGKKPGAGEGARAGNEDAAAKDAGAGWKFEGVTVADGKFSLSGFGSPAAPAVLPDLTLTLDTEIADLTIANGKVTSSAMQSLRVHDLVVDGGAEERVDEEGLKIARIRDILLEMVPDAFFGEGIIEKLHVDEPAFDVTSESIARFLSGEEKGVTPAGPGDNLPEAAPGRVYFVRDLAVLGGSLAIDPAGIHERLPFAAAAFELTTPGEEGIYELSLRDLRFRSPEDGNDELGQIESIDVRISAEGVQREKTIESVEIGGLHAAIGEPLQKLFRTAAGEGESATPDASPPLLQGWKIGEVNLKESTVSVSDILPELPMITFGVQTREALKDLTVGGGERKARDLVQRVELANLELTSQYNPAIPVADLRTIFIKFSLGGLLRREIDLVEIVTPDIYVGEHLFWYIDYHRRFSDERKAAREIAEGKGGGSAGAGGGGAGLETVAKRGWSIKKIEASSGRLIFAPKGVPVGSNPFPFSVSTNLESGEIDLELEVPKGTYTFPNMELELEGLWGTAQFNVPIKQKDNNLYEYFNMDKLRFRNYEAENVWVEITYDAAGVYTNFGGQAYEGYINGGFNVYVGDKYGWDAWVSGTEIALKPLTEVAAPGRFTMDGRMSGNLIGGGIEKDLATVHGDLRTMTPGRFEITKLNELLERLPPDWTQLKKTIAEVGISHLRDFDYSEGSGRAEYRNREIALVKELALPYFEREEELTRDKPKGILTLDLKGEGGSRSIELMYHDMRGREKPNSARLNASNP